MRSAMLTQSHVRAEADRQGVGFRVLVFRGEREREGRKRERERERVRETERHTCTNRHTTQTYIKSFDSC